MAGRIAALKPSDPSYALDLLGFLKYAFSVHNRDRIIDLREEALKNRVQWSMLLTHVGRVDQGRLWLPWRVQRRAKDALEVSWLPTAPSPCTCGEHWMVKGSIFIPAKLHGCPCCEAYYDPPGATIRRWV